MPVWFWLLLEKVDLCSRGNRDFMDGIGLLRRQSSCLIVLRRGALVLCKDFWLLAGSGCIWEAANNILTTDLLPFSLRTTLDARHHHLPPCMLQKLFQSFDIGIDLVHLPLTLRFNLILKFHVNIECSKSWTTDDSYSMCVLEFRLALSEIICARILHHIGYQLILDHIISCLLVEV